MFVFKESDQFGAFALHYSHLSEAKFGPLSDDELLFMYEDGRALSAPMAFTIGKLCKNLTLIPGEGKFDAEWDGHQPLELRGVSLKTNKALLTPSKQNGHGRTFDEGEHLSKLRHSSGYLLAQPLLSYRDVVLVFLPASFVEAKSLKEISSFAVLGAIGLSQHTTEKRQTALLEAIKRDLPSAEENKLYAAGHHFEW